MFSSVDVVVKHLGQSFHPLELAFFRYFIGTIILLPVFVRLGTEGMKTEIFGLHFLRLGLAYIAQLCIFVAVIYMPLADATALSFSKPLFTTIVAVIILSELVERTRWIATGVGFIGVLVMIRPGSGTIDPVAFLAILSALTFACGNVLIRVLARTEPTARILFYYHSGGLVIGFLTVVWVWKTPVGLEWLLLIIIGAVTTAGMTCYVRAFSVGEASAVGPSEYIRLIYAAIFGYFIFNETPDFWTITGAIIIVGAALFIARDEARSGKKERPN
jgi:drug/metabolite transporter (DMT)-like permease